MRHLTKQLLITMAVMAISFSFTLHPSPFTCMNAYAASKGADPVAYWRFDEGGGPTAYDETTNNNDGTLNATPGGTNTAVGQMWTRQGKIGGALECDGTDDYVSVGDSASLKPTSAVTLEAWIKPVSPLSNYQMIIDKQTSTGSPAYTLRLDSTTGKILLRTSGTSATDLLGNTVLSANTWYYVVGVYDGATSKIYINGVLDNSQANTGSITYDTTPLSIGRRIDGYYFNGLIDDVKIYNYARTVDQILVDYNAGSAVHLGAGTDPNEGDPPVGYWKLDENTGATAYDRSGNNNNGTITEATWTAGKYGSALNFDGTNDEVAITSNSSIQLTSTATITAWIKVSRKATTSDQAIVSKNYDYLLNVFGTGRGASVGVVEVGGSDSGGVGHWKAGTKVVDDGNWHHIVFVKEPNNMYIYIDGTLDASKSETFSFRTTASSLAIGEVNAGTNDRPVNGLIDDVKIYNYARTQAQIAYDYNKGKPIAHYKFDEGGGVITHNEYSQAGTGGAAPVAWWRMDEASSGSADLQSIVDQSGYGNNGTGNNGANNTGMSWASGKIGPGTLDFDGTDDRVTLSAFSSPSSLNDFTIETWFYMDAHNAAGRSYILDFRGDGSATQDSFGLVIDNVAGTSEIHHFIAYSSGGYSEYDVPISSPIGGWHHTTLVREGTTFRAYYDAQQISNTFASGSVGSPKSDAMSLANGKRIGTYSAAAEGGNYWFNGRVDDVRIYNYARTAEQIYNDYKNTHGTLVGDTKFVDGKIGKALSFDGTGDYVEVSDNDIFDFGLSDDMSYSFWVKINSLPPTGASLLDKRDGTDKGYRIIVNSAGTLTAIWDAPTVGGKVVSYAASTGQWYHVAFVRDAETDLRLYVNGDLADTADDDSSATAANGVSLRIGYRGLAGETPDYLNGLIDDVRIYNYSRTADQIMQDCNAGAVTRLGAQSAGVADPWGGALPAAHWTLDENTGVLAKDVSGNGNNGTLTNGPTWTQGKVGPALSFDGSNDCIRIPVSSSIQGITSAMTISAWVYKKDTNSGVIINNHIQNYGSPVSGIIFSVSSGNYPSLQLRLNNTCCQAVTSSSAIQTNQWYHLVATWNGSIMKLYTNGILQSPTQSASGTNQMSRDLFIGINADDFFNSSFSGQFNGFIDNVKIYNYARTQAQIAWDYNQGKPVAHWRFDEAVSGAVSTSAGAIKDESDNNNDGTASNTTWSYATGKFGGALTFDGNDSISVSDSASLDFGTGDFTVEYWMYYTGSTAVNNVFRAIGKANTESSTPGWLSGITTYGGNGTNFKLLSSITNGAWGTGNLENGSYISTNTWYHVTLVRSGTTLKHYRNGSADGERTVSGMGANVDNNLTLDIGRLSAASPSWFVGKLEDIRIYNYARTAEQIQQDYLNGAAARLGD